MWLTIWVTSNAPSFGFRNVHDIKSSVSGTIVTANPNRPNHRPNAFRFGVFATKHNTLLLPGANQIKDFCSFQAKYILTPKTKYF